jgi:poly [ADP-ribose] polymerase
MSKKVTVSTKGHLIDSYCQYYMGTILEHNGSVYDCTLNQTDISFNKNKFYIMQIIKNGNEYIVYIRYGRIGIIGKIDYKEFTSEYSAIAFFEKQFRSKTGNDWNKRNNFVKKNKKYFLTEKECVDVPDEEIDDDPNCDDEEEMDERIIELVKLITNTTYMKNTLVQLEIDTKKMPLGKIGQEQIDSAYEILDKINKNLKYPEKLVDLSSEFYTLIPIACGRQIPPIINNVKLIGKNVNLLNELTQMVYGTKAVIKLKKDRGNLMKLYQDLHTEIIPLDESDKMYQILKEYLMNSRAPTHHFQFKILNIYEINREFERDAYDAFSKKISKKTLLFHGTRVPLQKTL